MLASKWISRTSLAMASLALLVGGAQLALFTSDAGAIGSIAATSTVVAAASNAPTVAGTTITVTLAGGGATSNASVTLAGVDDDGESYTINGNVASGDIASATEAASGYVATFTVTGGTYGDDPITFTATDVTDGSIVINQTAVVTFYYPTPAYLASSVTSQTISSGDALGTISIDVEEYHHYIIGDSTEPITVAISSSNFPTQDPGYTDHLGGTLTVNAVNGVATFSDLTLSGEVNSGTPYYLNFTDAGGKLATDQVTVGSPGSITELSFDNFGTSHTPGTFQFQPIVYTDDSAGNLNTTGTNSITLSSTGGSGSIACTNLTVAATGGVANFAGCGIATSGSYTITASSDGLTSATHSYTISAGPPATVTIDTQPSGAVNGVALTQQPIVTVTDSGDSPVSGATVTASVVSGTGTLTNFTATTDVNGQATFSGLTITGTTGAFTLAFTDSPATLTSSSFNLTAGSPNSVSIGTEPAGAVNGVALTTQPTVTVEDASSNGVSGITVTASVASGDGTLTNKTAVTDSSGVATFSGLTLSGIAGAFTLNFTVTPIEATSSSFTLAVGAATGISIDTQPSGAVNGVALLTQPIVRVTDSSGNDVVGDTVTAAVASGTGSLTNFTATTDSSGDATFSGLKLTGTDGSFTLTFTDNSLSATSNSFSLTVGVAAIMTINTQPSGAVNGVALTTQPIVTVTDAGGNAIDGAQVTATVASGTGNLTSFTATANSSGQATFSGLTLTGTDGSFTLTFTDSAAHATSSSFSLTVGAVASITFNTQPSGAVDGVAFTGQPIVLVKDAGGNVITSGTVTVSVASGTGTLTNMTASINGSGIATFSGLTLNGTAGAFTLTFTDGSITATSGSFNLTAGAAAIASLTTQPTGAVNGLSLTTQPVVVITDADGNVVSGGTVTATISTGSGTLTNFTATTNSLGVATFSGLKFNGTDGSVALTFSDGSASIASNLFTLSVGAAATISITTQPSGAVNGVALTTQPVVSVTDAGGNIVSSGTVVAVVATGTGTVTGANVSLNGSGVATFTSLALTGTDGSFTLTFVDGAASKTSSSFALASGVASQISFDTEPSGAVNGLILSTQPIVTVKDANGNVISGDTVTVTVVSGSGFVTSATATTNGSGVATFTSLAVYGTDGAYTLKFADGAAHSNATSFNLSTGAADFLNITTQPGDAVDGEAFTQAPSVTVYDVGSNPVAGDQVTASVSFGTGTLTNYYATTNSSGVATFDNISLVGHVATYELGFTDGAAYSSSDIFDLSVGAVHTLSVLSQPSGAAAGVVLTGQPEVVVKDIGGNVVSGDTVTASIASGSGDTSGTTTATSDVDGDATFSGLSIDGAVGSFTLTFGDSGITATSSSFNLTAGPAFNISITTEPSGAQNGYALTTQPVVNITDVDGNPIANDTVTATIYSGTGTISDASVLTDVDGNATFTGLEVDGTVGAFDLTFTDGSLSEISENFTLAPGDPNQVVITTEPVTTNNNATFAVTGAIEDSLGNIVTTDSTSSVTLSISTDPSAGVAVLGCTNSGGLTVTVSSGIANFTGCSIATIGTGYQLLVADTTDSDSTTSSAFNIVSPPAVVTPPVVAQPPATAPSGSLGTPVTGSASTTTTTEVSVTSGTTSSTISVPAGALPAGTSVSVYPVTNSAALQAQVPAGSSYVAAVAVTWITAAGGTSPNATTPITLTITDPSIKAGDVIYVLTSSGLTPVGIAQQDGSATVTFSDDPTFLIATPQPQAALTLTSATAVDGTAIALSASGGSGAGAVTYAVTSAGTAGCSISGTSLISTSAGTCTVTATKAANAQYSTATSTATTYTFTAKPKIVVLPKAVIVSFTGTTATLSAAAKAHLRALAKALKVGATVKAVGYALHNSKLALARAKAIRTYLLSLKKINVRLSSVTSKSSREVVITTIAL